jgi:hypothetical protein
LLFSFLDVSAVKYTEYIRVPPADDSIAEQIRATTLNNSVDANNDPDNSVQYKRLPARKTKQNLPSASIGQENEKTLSYVRIFSRHINTHICFLRIPAALSLKKRRLVLGHQF